MWRVRPASVASSMQCSLGRQAQDGDWLCWPSWRRWQLVLKADQQCPELVPRCVPVARGPVTRVGVYHFAEKILDGLADLLQSLPLAVQPGRP